MYFFSVPTITAIEYVPADFAGSVQVIDVPSALTMIFEALFVPILTDVVSSNPVPVIVTVGEVPAAALEIEIPAIVSPGSGVFAV